MKADASLARNRAVPTRSAGWPLAPSEWPRVLSGACALAGLPCELGVHPTGIVLTADPVEAHASLQRGPGGVRLAQFDKDACARVGLVKLDLLSSRALSCLAEAAGHIQALAPDEAGEAAEDGDALVMALLARGDTLANPQLEPPRMRRAEEAGPGITRPLSPRASGRWLPSCRNKSRLHCIFCFVSLPLEQFDD
jgi:DNA polymerase III alpha subunit